MRPRTGEGAMAFGHGLYFTNKKEIAQEYAKRLSGANGFSGAMSGKASFYIKGKKAVPAWREGEDIFTIGDDIDLMKIQAEYQARNPDYMGFYEPEPRKIKPNEYPIFNTGGDLSPEQHLESFLEAHKGSKIDVVSDIKERLKNKDLNPQLKKDYNTVLKLIKDNGTFYGGPIYKATLHKGKTPNQYDYLKWDKPLSESSEKKIREHLDRIVPRRYGKQPEQIKEVKNEFNRIFGGARPYGEDTYNALSKALNGDKNASEFLLEAGIDGIDYPAGSLSGIASNDARNYVVFDPNAVTIESINDIPFDQIIREMNK